MKKCILAAIVLSLVIACSTPLVAEFCKRCDDQEARELSTENYICPNNSTCPHMRYVLEKECRDKAWNETGNSNCTDTQDNNDLVDYYNIDYAWSSTNCTYAYLGSKGAGAEIQFGLFPTTAALEAEGYTHCKTVTVGGCDCYDPHDSGGEYGRADCYPFEQ